MPKFCPECGFKLDREYKYCPECGFDLSLLQENDKSENQDSRSNEQLRTFSKKFIVCDNCGEENFPENEVCSSCGIKLEGEEIEKEISEPQVRKEEPVKKAEYKAKPKSKPKPQVKKVAKPSASNAKKNQTEGKKQPKSLSTGNIITIVAGGIIVLAIILFSNGVFDSPPPEPAQNVTTGQESNSTVNLANLQQINKLESQVAANPKDAKLILKLAHLKNDSNLFEQAIKNYKQYLALKPKDPDARIDMGICYYNLGKYDTAINEMEQALKYDPKHQIGYLDLGIVNLTAGNIEKSKDWLRKAVKLDPSSEYGKKAQELLQSHTMNQ